MAGDHRKQAASGSGLSARRAWEAALPRIRSRVGDTNFRAWIAPLEASGDRETVALTAPTATISASVSRHFVPLISKVLAEVSGREWYVRVSMDASPAAEPAAAPDHGNADPGATFDRFVVGDSNREAFQQAQAVADGTFAGPSPLVLFGDVGLGKTHLAGAIGNAVHVRWPRRCVVCEPATEFVNRLLGVMRGDQAAADDELTDVAVLILDDIHFLAGHTSTQEALVWTFTVLHERGIPVVLTSDRAPQEIPDVDERLRRRFEGGVLARLDAPERDLRRRILLQKAADRGLELPPDVATFVASRVIGSGRTLEGALTRLFAYAAAGPGAKPSPLTRSLATRALRAFEAPRQPVTPEVVRAVVCEARGLPLRALASRSRARDVTVARQLAMYLCRDHSRLPLREIAVRFGRRDHSTVLHACEVIEAKRAADPAFDAAVRRMEELIRTRAR
jgi:chromosomal replication initiator protein